MPSYHGSLTLVLPGSDRPQRFYVTEPDDLPDDIERVASLLSQETGDTPHDVIRKALALYATATRGVRQGKTVAILDGDEVEREFTGFGPSKADC
jgi:hypothetical protein